VRVIVAINANKDFGRIVTSLFPVVTNLPTTTNNTTTSEAQYGIKILVNLANRNRDGDGFLYASIAMQNPLTAKKTGTPN